MIRNWVAEILARLGSKLYDASAVVFWLGRSAERAAYEAEKAEVARALVEVFTAELPEISVREVGPGGGNGYLS